MSMFKNIFLLIIFFSPISFIYAIGSTEGFETYSNGDIDSVSSGVWYNYNANSGSSRQVTTSKSHSGNKSLSCTGVNDCSSHDINTLLSLPKNHGKIGFWYYPSTVSSAMYGDILFETSTSSNPLTVSNPPDVFSITFPSGQMGISFNALDTGTSGDCLALGYTRSGCLSDTTQYLIAGAWNYIEIEYYYEGSIRVKVNNYQSDWFLFAPYGVGVVDFSQANIFRLDDGSKSGSSYYFDDFSISTTTGTVTDDGGCSTCTRLFNFVPVNSSNVATSTYLNASLQYYVKDTDRAGFLGTTKIYYKVEHTSGSYEEHEIEVLNYNQIKTLPITLTSITKEGTYAVTAKVYNDYSTAFFDTDISRVYYYSFYSGTTTKFGDDVLSDSKTIIEATYGQINCEIDFPIDVGDFACIGQYIVATFIPTPSVVATEFKTLIGNVLAIPPWGYVTQVYNTLLNPATTTVPTLTLSMTSAMPVSGNLLTLSPTTGINKFNTVFASTTTISGSTRTYGEHLLFYWEMFWYILFAFWLLRELLGFTVTYGPETEYSKPENYQKSGTVHMGKNFSIINRRDRPFHHRGGGARDYHGTSDINMKK